MSGVAVQGTIVHRGSRDPGRASSSPNSCRQRRRRSHQLHLVLIAGVLLALLPRFAAGASSCGMGWVSHFCRGGNKRSMEGDALLAEDSSSNNDQRQTARNLLLELLRQAKQPEHPSRPQDEQQNDDSGERWPSAGSPADDELPPAAADDDYLAIPRVDDVKVDPEVRRRSGNVRKTQTSTQDDRQESGATGGLKTLPTRRRRPWSGRRPDGDTSAAAVERSMTSTSELDRMVDGLLRRRLAAAASAGGGRREAAADGEVEKDDDVIGVELDDVRPKEEPMDRVESYRAAETGAGKAADAGVSSRPVRPPSAVNDGGRWRTWFGR